MHREFKSLLENATGIPHYIITVNLDIREFSSFCQRQDSLDVATYIRKVYLKILNEYFKDASYYKPTGDGLIIIIPYTEPTLKEVVNSTLNSCLVLLEKFGSLCIGDPMITYITPQKIGIGLARGSACCITSEGKTLDYSGRILNLASRLMDFARPSGIVFDESFDINLLPDETKNLFLKEPVYVRGISEEVPIMIYHTKDTLIPDYYKRPLKEPKWNTETWKYSLETLQKITAENLFFRLSQEPLDERRIRVTIIWPSPKLKGIVAMIDYNIDNIYFFYEKNGRKEVLIKLEFIHELAKNQGITQDMEIRFDITYPVR